MCVCGTCRSCRAEERAINKAMGTERIYIRSRSMNREERDKHNVKQAKVFDF